MRAYGDQRQLNQTEDPLMSLSFSFHIIGIVMWLGGLLLITRFISILPEGEVAPEIGAGVKKMFYGWVMGGLALVTITGFYQFLSIGAGFYMKQGWFHAKLTLLIGLYLVSFLTMKKVKVVSEGMNLHPKKVMALHGITGLCLFAMVMLTFLGRA